MTSNKCHYHYVGTPPDAKPFFLKGCPQCEQKKLDGKVTGNEPPPQRRSSYSRSHQGVAITTLVAALRSRGLKCVGSMRRDGAWFTAGVVDATGAERGTRWLRMKQAGGVEVVAADPIERRRTWAA